MTEESVSTAIDEANRFIERAEAYLARNQIDTYYQPRESGALRRASMDLTRALADMRRR